MHIIKALVTLVIGWTVSTGSSACAIELFVLGAGQDAGAPQIGNHADIGWMTPEATLLPASIAVVDHTAGDHFLFEATPAIGAQLKFLDTLLSQQLSVQSITGILLTHAHIGHYAGLMYLGREAAGASKIPVHGLPRMMDFLTNNGPWSQLVDIGNIALRPMHANQPVQLNQRISVTAIVVPHRDEFSETAGFVIETAQTRTLFVPDIDSWDQWLANSDKDIAQIVGDVDLALVDATFFDDNELPGRDMSAIPHPRVTKTMARLAHLSDQDKSNVHFIHYNHTNPIRFADSPAATVVAANGFAVARRGDRHCLLRQDK